MKHRVDEVARKTRKFAAFVINGAIASALIWVMLIFIMAGHGYPGCTESPYVANVRWGFIFSIPIILLINVQAYLLTKSTHSPGLRGMVLGLSVSMAAYMVISWSIGSGQMDGICYVPGE